MICGRRVRNVFTGQTFWISRNQRTTNTQQPGWDLYNSDGEWSGFQTNREIDSYYEEA